MPNAASLKNLRPWKPGQSGNPNERPRFHDSRSAIRHDPNRTLRRSRRRDAPGRHQGNEGGAANPRTVLKALELGARLNGVGRTAGVKPVPTFVTTVESLVSQPCREVTNRRCKSSSAPSSKLLPDGQ